MKKNFCTAEKCLYFNIFRIGVICAAAVYAILRTLSFFFFYDAEIMYFSQGGVLPAIATAVLVIAVACSAFYAFMFRSVCPSAEKYSVSSRCAAVFAALAFAVYAVSALFDIYGWADFLRLQNAEILASAGFVSFVTALNLIAPMLACAYFALYAVRKLSPALSFFGGIGVILWSVIILALGYFNNFIPMNSPVKLGEHLCCVASMLFIVCEMRVMCSADRKALRLFCSALAVVSLIPTALSDIIACVGGVFTEGAMALPSVENYVFLAIGVFALARLIMLDGDPADEVDNECE